MARMNNPGRTFAAYGDSASHNVRELQQVLQQLGVYSGAVTGTFDDATYQAYRQACRAAHFPISRDKKGRLVVTLGDFEALEQLDAGAVDFAAAETQVEAEDDFAKRPVDASELEEDSAKYPAVSNSGKPVRRRWVVLLAALGVVVAAAVILATRPTRDADDPQQAAPTATALPTATAMPTSNPQDFEISITGNKTCSITGYTGNDTQLEIPSTIQGYTVTAIGNSAFAYCDSLTSITIPGSVWVIGDSAFFNCDSLTSITIPDSVTTIGDYAFVGCESLTSITIPNSVTAIGTNPFRVCAKLTDIIVSPDHPTLATIDGVLFDKVEKTLICYPYAYTNSSYAIPQGIRVIGDDAFSCCDSLTSITIPDSVTAIGHRAFLSCDALTSITIPESVTAIGDGAFSWCFSLTSITIPDSVTYIRGWAFEDCDFLTAVYVTENSYAHQYCIDNNLPYVLQ